MRKIVFLLLSSAMLMMLNSSCKEKDPPNMYGKIHGVVIDKETGESIALAKVTLSPGGNNQITGTDGRFEFINLDPMQYTITVDVAGYKPDLKTVTVLVDEIAPANFLLTKKP